MLIDSATPINSTSRIQQLYSTCSRMARWRHIRPLYTLAEVNEERQKLNDRSGTWTGDGNTTNEVRRRIDGGRIMGDGGEQERSEYWRCRIPACRASSKIVVRFRTSIMAAEETFVRGWRYYSTEGHTFHQPMGQQEMLQFDAGM
uniref:Uncharacterized protein n=2 Tax=Meloidogyne TaxID=189290 RepID=A0A6V7UCG2_MELEN|nr:unnamed protein product [Meloidogyne enterolobii]CAD2204921.1 unnamed protein product [Meloidogyne enterolobii]